MFKKIWIKMNKFRIWGIFGIMVFPIIVGLFYAMPIPQIVNVKSGDLLAYYGAIFGILGSFVTYRYEINKKKKERNKELKPTFCIELILQKNNSTVFIIKIRNYSKNHVSGIYLCDKYICEVIEKEVSLYVTFNGDNEKIKSLQSLHGNNYFDFTVDTNVIDSDGLPKYISLLCDDMDSQTWLCNYSKAYDDGKKHYYIDSVEIL